MKKKIDINQVSNKKFGLTFSLLFFFIAIFFVIKNSSLYNEFLFFSLFLFIISFYKPSLLYIPNFLWFKLSVLLSYITNPIITIFIYLIFVLPIGLILKILNNNPLKICVLN